MKRITPISKRPEHAAAAPDVKITFVIQLLEISRPLFSNKDPENPLPPGDTGSGNDDS